jgi:tetratricopeptide (TPR) repeat protein
MKLYFDKLITVNRPLFKENLMKTKTFLLIIALVLLVLPVMAQNQAEEEEAQYNCPAFTDASTTERSSYYMGEGAAFMRSGNYASAINSYGCIIQQIDSDFRDAYLNRAAAYVARREFDEALEDYAEAIRIDNNFSPTYNNRGVVNTAIEEYDAALADFNRALDMDSNYAAAYINRGIVSAIQSEWDNAQADFEMAIDVAGLDTIVTELRDPDRDPEAERPNYDFTIARAYALIGVIHSQRALQAYDDYLLLTGGRADQRIQSAAGALRSRFQFELRFDDGAWMLLANFVEG